MKVIPIDLFNKWCNDKQYHQISNDVALTFIRKTTTLKNGKQFVDMKAYDSVNDEFYKVFIIKSDKYYGMCRIKEYEEIIKKLIYYERNIEK